MRQVQRPLFHAASSGWCVIRLVYDCLRQRYYSSNLFWSKDFDMTHVRCRASKPFFPPAKIHPLRGSSVISTSV